MFNLFGSRKSKPGLRPPRAPGDTVRPGDLHDLTDWANTHAGIDGFVEPETLVNEMSIVLVDVTGDFIRRPIGGPKGVDAIAKALGVPIYDVEETGYPQRMRERIERERLIRKRQEQQQRRARFERGELP